MHIATQRLQVEQAGLVLAKSVSLQGQGDSESF
jgi:hypothetical protein